MRRYPVGLASLAFAGLFAVAAAIPVSAQTPAPPVAPTNLNEILPGTGHAIAAGGWINQTSIALQISVQANTSPLTPQVEVEPSGVPFTGVATQSAATVSSSGPVTVHVGNLQSNRTYHWQARVVDSGGNSSPWSVFGPTAASDDFGIDQTPPSRPTIRSRTNPNPNRAYGVRTVDVSWSAHDNLSGIQGYTYAIERNAHVIPPGSTTPHTGARISNLSDGVWFLAIRAEDRAGNWGPTGTYRIALDRQPARIAWLSPARMQFNPYQGPLVFHFRVSKPARATFTLFRVGSGSPVATFTYGTMRPGITQTLTWSGKGPRGHFERRGYYFFSAVVIDTALNVSRVNIGGIILQASRPARAVTGQLLYPNGGKLIIVSLSRQTLYAYDGTRLVQQTFVTTGNPSLPTPTGTFQVMAKYHPYEFISPWPPGSPYWYAPSWVQYAMLFRDGGYFLHDAPWRSAFGPGTNGAGQPGTNYGGTHGCVNIPPTPMLFLWNWTPIGTTVDVVP